MHDVCTITTGSAFSISAWGVASLLIRYRIRGRKPKKTNIEYSQRKDGSISVIISGKAAAVTEAKKQILANLTQQGNRPRNNQSKTVPISVKFILPV